MIILFIPLCLAYIVSIKDLDYYKDYAILYTKSVKTQESFIDSIQLSSLQSTYIFCYNDPQCDFSSDSKLIIFLNQAYFTYTWEFTEASFKEYFHKITSPAVQNINSTEAFEAFSSHKISFLFTYTDPEELSEFSSIAEKYKTSHMYFGAVFNKTFEKNQKNLTPGLRLLGVDKIFKHSAQNRFEDFIENFKCPLLLEYQKAVWVEECLSNKIVLASVVNKRRKHMWSLYGGRLKTIAQDLNDSSYQMMFVDNRKSEDYLKFYGIPFIPFVMILDNRVNKVYYLGEYALKSTKKVEKMLSDIKINKLHPEDYTIDKIQYTHYLDIWQSIPLLVLLFGLLVIFTFCYRATIEKVKIN